MSDQIARISEIIHDINNSLSILYGSLELELDRIAQERSVDTSRLERIDRCLTHSKRISGLIRELDTIKKELQKKGITPLLITSSPDHQRSGE